jgi:hypothetical protein
MKGGLADVGRGRLPSEGSASVIIKAPCRGARAWVRDVSWMSKWTSVESSLIPGAEDWRRWETNRPRFTRNHREPDFAKSIRHECPKFGVRSESQRVSSADFDNRD